MNQSGIVNAVSHKNGMGRNGKPWSMIAFKIQGSDQWHSFFTGRGNPSTLNEGDSVEFTAEQNGNYSNIKEIKVTHGPGSSRLRGVPANLQDDRRVEVSLARGLSMKDLQIAYLACQHDAVAMHPKGDASAEQITELTYELVAGFITNVKTLYRIQEELGTEAEEVEEVAFRD